MSPRLDVEVSMDPGLPRPAPHRPVGQRVREWVDWFGVGRLLATAVAVVAVVGAAAWLLKGSSPRVEDGLPYARVATSVGTASTAVSSLDGSTTSSTVTVVVYVTGAVAAPGVYTLPGGVRIDAALDAAGGSTPDADLGVLNLAAPVHDGERVFVPRVGQAIPAELPSATALTAAPVGPVNLNTAGADELDALPGVGPATAAAIIARRQEQGPFASVDDLADVRGIGPAKLAALRGLVTV